MGHSEGMRGSMSSRVGGKVELQFSEALLFEHPRAALARSIEGGGDFHVFHVLQA